MLKEEPSICVSGRTSAHGIAHAAPTPAPVVRSDRSVSVGTAVASRALRLLKKSSGTQANPAKALWTPSDSFPNGASSADPDPAEASLSDTNEIPANEQKQLLPPLNTLNAQSNSVFSHTPAADVLVLQEAGAVQIDGEAARKRHSAAIDRSRVHTGHRSAVDSRSLVRSPSRHTAASSTRAPPPPIPLTKKQLELEVNLARIRECTQTARARGPNFNQLLHQVISNCI